MFFRYSFTTPDSVDIWLGSETELLMRHSPTSYLEVLTAKQSLLSAQQNEAQCRYEEIAGIISLYHALGGGK